MKRYEKLCKNPLELAEYITKKLQLAVQTIAFKTENRFYNSNSERAAVKGIILTQLLEDIEENDAK